VAVTLAAKDHVIHLFPLKAQVFGGQYSGDIAFDSCEVIPALSLDEHLAGIDVGKLAASGSKKVHVSGHGNVDLKATARGAAADAILKTLNGRFDLDVTNGALEGLDLGFQLTRAESILSRQGAAAGTDTGRTSFGVFKLSADIVNGVATTKDLILSSPVIRVTGAGSANLSTQALDVALLVDTLKSAGGTPLKIPVTVTGSFTSPSVRPDVAALATGALKQKAQDLLKDKLKSLFH
jgi:AsmA protein